MQSQFIKAKFPLTLLFKLASSSVLSLVAVFAPLPSLADDACGLPGICAENPLLPVILTPPFIIEFPFEVTPGIVFFIDPDIAIGYTYSVSPGSPLFTSVLPPAGINDDNTFDLYFSADSSGSPGSFTQFITEITGGTEYIFSSPQSSFSIQGIDLAAQLSTTDPTAFVTGVSFNVGGSPIVTQTPIPAPGPLPLLGAAAAWGWSRRLRSRIRLKRMA